MVRFLRDANTQKDAAISQIILANHPLFDQMKKLMKIPYRIFFTNHDEMIAWLNARSYAVVDKKDWDDPGYEEFTLDPPKKKIQYLLKIHIGLFGKDGNLQPMTQPQWRDNFVRFEERSDEDSVAETSGPSPVVSRTPRSQIVRATGAQPPVAVPAAQSPPRAVPAKV